jgi:hypothetical protein
MADNDQWYDEDTRTVWVYKDYDEDTLVPNDELKEWIRIKQEGETSEGQPVDRVNFVFSGEGAADYNHQALQYAGLGTYIGDHDEQRPHDADEIDFEAREDFGIE